MRMALAGMNSAFFTPFNMLKFLMQQTTDRELFLDFRDPRDFGRLGSGRELIEIRLFSRHQQHVASSAHTTGFHFRLIVDSLQGFRSADTI